MANKVRFVLDKKAVSEVLLSGPEIQKVCNQYAERVRAAAGDGFSTDPYKGERRVNVRIKADTDEARARNIAENVLLKALGGSKK